jgi:hypothetical protein
VDGYICVERMENISRYLKVGRISMCVCVCVWVLLLITVVLGARGRVYVRVTMLQAGRSRIRFSVI